MARSVADLMADVRAAGSAAIEIAGGLDLDGLAQLPLADNIRYRALKNALTEIGEAIRMTPSEILAEHPSVDWRGFVGLRNIVTHQYFGLEPEILHAVLNEELPALLEVVARIEDAHRDPG